VRPVSFAPGILLRFEVGVPFQDASISSFPLHEEIWVGETVIVVVGCVICRSL
jgi:hypothetical protein